MYKFITDETNRILNYVPTTYRIVGTESERPPLPENPKIGVNYVEYWNEETQKIELREEERPLTQQELIERALHEAEDAKKRAQAAIQGLAAITEGMEEPTVIGGDEV